MPSNILHEVSNSMHIVLEASSVWLNVYEGGRVKKHSSIFAYAIAFLASASRVRSYVPPPPSHSRYILRKLFIILTGKLIKTKGPKCCAINNSNKPENY